MGAWGGVPAELVVYEDLQLEESASLGGVIVTPKKVTQIGEGYEGKPLNRLDS